MKFSSKSPGSSNNSSDTNNLSTTSASISSAHDADTTNTSADRPRLSRGGRNLIILGIGATLIAILTTTVGLAIYHLSGDIYLDRSRPGYLPDETEVEEEAETASENYNFEKTGKITKQTIDEYLEHLTDEIEAVDNYKDPFAPAILSDDHFGIPSE